MKTVPVLRVRLRVSLLPPLPLARASSSSRPLPPDPPAAATELAGGGRLCVLVGETAGALEVACVRARAPGIAVRASRLAKAALSSCSLRCRCLQHRGLA